MTTGSHGAGTLLAGRYRFEDLLTEHAGAHFWRATDTVLARSVAIHAVPSEDPRARSLMEAARLSATVNDSHLLRVLDADDDGELAWVVNEWGAGLSLDLMLQRGVLAPERAAWLTREVAEAVAAGHRQGVAHGRLNPEAVLVTHAGSVKLIGYVVDASLDPPVTDDPVYGALDERRADVINLGGLLFASLTGRWPGVAPSSVPAAPRESHRPLRPRQVRAGVPRVLDAICDQVLQPEGSHHVHLTTAHEVAAALADFTGGVGAVEPVALAAMHDEPTVAVPAPSATDDEPTRAVPDPEDHPENDPDDPEATQLSAAVPDSRPGPAMEHTALHREPLESPDSLRPMQAPDVVPPPPPFEDSPERPLFSTTERRVPAGAAAALEPTERWDAGTGSHQTGSHQTGSHHTGSHHTATHGGGDAGPESWLFTDTDPAPAQGNGHEGRGWLRTAVVIGVVLVTLVAMAVAFTLGRQDGSVLSGLTGGDDDPTQASQTPSQRLEVASVEDFDPEGDPSDENPEEAPAAIDGDPATAWTTVTYRNRPDLGGLKDGVGLMLDLGEDREVGSVVVRFATSPTSFSVYAAPRGATSFPTAVSDMEEVATRDAAPARAAVRLDSRPTTRYLLVWLTELPPADGGYQGAISEIAVRS
ncbi:hypothetical protein ASG49_14455 [Marmoricola sp. Leaf446]|uniref:protein kinase family protein n=1 Tax=Marmoricola sp. Leaf446 TaxID=1736379 RepID=UPI0006FC0513|nr:protein kinase family protein [Marmoricola sp. Leaf446]KQT90913.1 hypothetical protein ASG49_14455 [Marmoricola sp. Leaf446]